MPNGQTVHIQPQVQGGDWKILASRVLSFSQVYYQLYLGLHLLAICLTISASFPLI